jgi:hypothetical protein
MNNLRERFETFSDEQRCERLSQCQPLTHCVQNCLQRQRDRLAGRPPSVEPIALEDFTAGKRMLHFFNWSHQSSTKSLTTEKESAKDGALPASSSSSSFFSNLKSMESNVNKPDKTSSTSTAIASGIPMEDTSPPTCAQEIHAQWGCRAVALACSSHLVELRECFESLRPNSKDIVLSVPYFGYAPGDESKRIPCRSQQELLGACVSTRAAELEQRVRGRQKGGQ